MTFLPVISTVVLWAKIYPVRTKVSTYSFVIIGTNMTFLVAKYSKLIRLSSRTEKIKCKPSRLPIMSWYIINTPYKQTSLVARFYRKLSLRWVSSSSSSWPADVEVINHMQRSMLFQNGLTRKSSVVQYRIKSPCLIY